MVYYILLHILMIKKSFVIINNVGFFRVWEGSRKLLQLGSINSFAWNVKSWPWLMVPKTSRRWPCMGFVIDERCSAFLLIMGKKCPRSTTGTMVSLFSVALQSDCFTTRAAKQKQISPISFLIANGHHVRRSPFFATQWNEQISVVQNFDDDKASIFPVSVSLEVIVLCFASFRRMKKWMGFFSAKISLILPLFNYEK